VGALWGYGDETELTEAGSTVLCSSTHDLTATIRNLLSV
jgi:phosphoglycolate phosphatase